MTITKIESLGKNRYLIYIDYSIAFVLYKGDLKLLGIFSLNELNSGKENYIENQTENQIKSRIENQGESRVKSNSEVLWNGSAKRKQKTAGKLAERRSYEITLDISEELYNQILDDVLSKRGMQRCLFLLEKKDYTERQIREKLREGYYPEKVVDEIIEKIKSYGYVDDLRYARRFIEFNIKTKSKRRIMQDLFSKGISKETIENAFENASDDGMVQDEEEIIRSLLRKRHYYDKEITQKERAKQYAYLAGKGFSSSMIIKCLGGEDDC